MSSNRHCLKPERGAKKSNYAQASEDRSIVSCIQGANNREGKKSRNSSAAAAGQGAGSRAAWKRLGLPHHGAQQPLAFTGSKAATVAGTALI